MLGPCFVVMLETGLTVEKILQVLQRSPEAGARVLMGLSRGKALLTELWLAILSAVTGESRA